MRHGWDGEDTKRNGGWREIGGLRRFRTFLDQGILLSVAPKGRHQMYSKVTGGECENFLLD